LTLKVRASRAPLIPVENQKRLNTRRGSSSNRIIARGELLDDRMGVKKMGMPLREGSDFSSLLKDQSIQVLTAEYSCYHKNTEHEKKAQSLKKSLQRGEGKKRAGTKCTLSGDYPTAAKRRLRKKKDNEQKGLRDFPDL